MFVPKNWPIFKISGAQKRRKIQDKTVDQHLKLFWTLMLKNNDFQANSRVCQIAVKIMRVENPSNVMAESIGRISNMIRDPKYSARMGNCTLDSRLILYKTLP